MMILLLQKEQEDLAQLMSSLHPSDEEYQEFLDFMEEYRKKKKIKEDKFHESMIYSIYQWFKKT